MNLLDDNPSRTSLREFFAEKAQVVITASGWAMDSILVVTVIAALWFIFAIIVAVIMTAVKAIF